MLNDTKNTAKVALMLSFSFIIFCTDNAKNGHQTQKSHCDNHHIRVKKFEIILFSGRNESKNKALADTKIISKLRIFNKMRLEK